MLLAGAATLLMMCRLAAWLLPLRAVARMAQAVAPAGSGREEVCPETSARIGWAVRAAAWRVKGAQCLPQALAAYLLLAWHGQSSQLVVGAQLAQSGRLVAHAWVECGGRVIVGGRGGLDRFIPLFTLGAAGLQRRPGGQAVPRPER